MMREGKKQLSNKYGHKLNPIIMEGALQPSLIAIDGPLQVGRSSWVNLLIFKEVKPNSTLSNNSFRSFYDFRKL